MTGTAYKAEATVGAGGRVVFDLPLPAGTAVEVIVFVPPPDSCSDLVAAASSVTSFWDNSLDDEDWNAPDAR